MQIPQITYDVFPKAALAGQLADTAIGTMTESRVAEAELSAGRFVVSGTSSGQVKLPASGAEVTNKLRGVALYRGVKEARGPIGGPYDPQFGPMDSVPVGRTCRVWVPVVAADIADDAVPYIVFSGGDAGCIRGTSDAAAQAAPSGVKVAIGAAVGGVALVELNLP